MSFLEQFSAAEKELLVSLPWRAGLWVSVADGTGGHVADAAETAALEAIIAATARGMFESALVHEVMSETSARRADRRAWSKVPDDVPAACREAVAIIRRQLPERDAVAYGHNIMQIAVAVARAFREFDLHAPLSTRLLTGLRHLLDKLVGTATGQVYESDSLLNISYEEDLALAQLAGALEQTQEGP